MVGLWGIMPLELDSSRQMVHPRDRKRENPIKVWYEEIPCGKFSGNPPMLQLVGPDLWVYHPDKEFPFTFTRDNGGVTTLDASFSSDLGSVPGILRGLSYLSKGYYGIAYLLHDWLWHQHKKLLDGCGYTYYDTNIILVEAIKTLNEYGYISHNTFDGGATAARRIWVGVNSIPAKILWNSHYAQS